jgi:hypothetical protein
LGATEQTVVVKTFEKCALQIKRLREKTAPVAKVRLTWVMCLLADTVALLRAAAFTTKPSTPDLMENLAPRQLSFQLADG